MTASTKVLAWTLWQTMQVLTKDFYNHHNGYDHTNASPVERFSMITFDHHHEDFDEDEDEDEDD